jgi:hypothetical protein
MFAVADALPTRDRRPRFSWGSGCGDAGAASRRRVGDLGPARGAGFCRCSRVGGSLPTVESRGGLDRGLTLHLQFREVRILADVGDQRISEESGQGVDELRRERRGGGRGDWRRLQLESRLEMDDHATLHSHSIASRERFCLVTSHIFPQGRDACQRIREHRYPLIAQRRTSAASHAASKRTGLPPSADMKPHDTTGMVRFTRPLSRARVRTVEIPLGSRGPCRPQSRWTA